MDVPKRTQNVAEINFRNSVDEVVKVLRTMGHESSTQKNEFIGFLDEEMSRLITVVSNVSTGETLTLVTKGDRP